MSHSELIAQGVQAELDRYFGSGGYVQTHGDSENGDDDWGDPFFFGVDFEGKNGEEGYAEALCDAAVGTVAEQVAFMIEQLAESIPGLLPDVPVRSTP